MNDQPNGMLVVQVPMFTPSEEEVQAVRDNNVIEPFLQQLINDNYLTHEEVAAFLKFINVFSMYAPFILDSFLEGYRKSQEPDSQPKATDRLMRV